MTPSHYDPAAKLLWRQHFFDDADRISHNSMALQNITDGNPLRQNDDKCRYQIVIFI